MSGADKEKLDSSKDSDEPNFRHFEAAELSVSSNSGISDPPALSMDSYATQYVDRPLPTEESSEAMGQNAFPTDLRGFIVESELGRGAFGVVFCARDEMLDRRVAIKMPLISNPAHRQRYIDEARKAVKLDHPSIVPIYQVGITTNGEPFVVQKLILGSTLRQMIQNGERRLPIAQIVDIMRQVCLGVDAAHTAGVVHRDLKPENLLVETEGRVYVADFGLAILEDDESNKKGREVAGTPLYMSPEQFVGRVEWLDGRSDIWSLGVIMYELLLGKPPFSGASLSELKDQIRNKDPRPIHQRDPKIPSAFDAVFRKCCAKTVGNRFASVRELIADLDVIAESLPMLDTVNMMSSSQVGAFKGSSSSGSAIGSGVESSQGSVGTRSGNTSVAGRSTVRNSFGGSTFSQPANVWKVVAPLLISALFLSLVFGAVWFNKWGPFAVVEQKKQDGTDAGGNNAGGNNAGGNNAGGTGSDLQKKDSTKQTVESNPKLPSKPFRVSVDGKGTHESIAKAISDSAAGDIITILAGTYRESVVIDRSVKLIGQGEVMIISTEGACVKLQGDSQVSIEKVIFDSQASNFNTIDIHGGRLTLLQCDVFASSPESYDCVMVRANGTLVAEKCKFESTVHAAVSGESLSTIAIQDSSFSFAGNSGSNFKRIGIQATDAKGLFRNCIFMGPCVAGIDWKDSPDSDLTIEGCQFDNCEIGVQLRRCRSATIKGTNDQRCQIRNSVWGVSIKDSQVELSKCDMEGSSDRNRVALQITEKSRAKCSDCTLIGYAAGIWVNQSSLVVNHVLTRETGFVGMLVDGGSIEGNDLNLDQISCYGLAVMSKGASVKLESLVVEGAPVVGFGPPAVYVTSGTVDFKNGAFSNCLCGIFVDPSRAIINSTGLPEKRSLIELIGDPIKIQMTFSPIEVLSDRMTLMKCDYATVFNGIGSSRIKEIDGDLSEERRQPKVVAPELEVNAKNPTNFSVVKKSTESK